ncbi:hypothetical protein NH341_08375 [Tenacibaculum sp. XPcli2-G]|uniref:Uncharacterized protein n=1 Tax=Tenacibaculum sp. Pbs-1 TaxID=3238748 RepID=A0AB33KWT2_9FLAO|nr:hypothetical protein [Tenacibaculum sp. XPcli2-G]MCO7185439.1 hypothetical protein [Tenacibaculum sp. XPcli2-G]
MPSFVPLGIADYSGNSERGFVQFTYQIADNNAKELTLQIRDGSSVIYEEKITDANKLKQGEHIWKWDGFDSGGILDTAKLTQYENLNLYTIGVDNSNNYSRKKLDFSMRYDEVKWVDVKVDKNSKRIDVTLRVNLKDGGVRGVECKEVIHRDHLNPGMRTSKKVCPWDKIPQEALSYYGKSPIKNRTKSFEELKKMALEGINKYWSRHSNNIGKGVNINGEFYELYVNSLIFENGAKAPEITFLTNKEAGRSRNWELSRILFYNVGYLFYDEWKSLSKNRSLYKNKGWYYENGDEEDFKMTSAHEVGHEILLKYGGHRYSKSHKGSSTILTQEDKNIPLPKKGEIDLMKYYDNYYDKTRTVASVKDVLGLLWLTKLKLK